MSSPTLPLNLVVNVTVQVSPQAPAQPTFNQGLIVGTSAVIPSSGGVNNRIRRYFSLAAVAADGFATNSPEYIAASLYFSQLPTPQFLWIGRQDLTVISNINFHGANPGSGYQLGDILTVIQGGASGGTVHVDAVDVGGAVTAVSLVTPGTGYSVANSLATTGGHGAGAEMDIFAVGESPLTAVQACRLASFQWWAFMATAAVKADHEAIAAWAQTASPTCCYFFSTSDSDALAGTAGNVFSVLKAAGYNRVFGQYNTTQAGLAPNNIYAAAAAMGVAMGGNTGLANSDFTLKFKQQVGVISEPLSLTSITTIEGNNGNLYLNYGNAYNFLEQGVVANGQFFDEILNLDMLASGIQYAVMNLLTENPSIPQTDPGETQIIHAVNQACEAARIRGFIAGGIWQGQQIINLNPGDSLPNGYLAQAYPYSTQLPADRAARKAMPVYLAIIEAGAVHFVTIAVLVQR